jgi:hypothetical protein
MHDELWRKIIELHNTNKSLFIWCEENEVCLVGFLQPNNEFKNAWEHVVRAKANELGLSGTPNLDYQKATLEDALAHEYRAFFDICDWASVILRKRAIDLLKPYDEKTISSVIPNYYSEIRTNFENASTSIAALRGGKDIAQSGDILDRVREYKAIIVNLTAYDQIIGKSVSVLVLKKRVNDALAPYDPDSIKEVIPNYWSEIRLNLDRNCNKLAQLLKLNGSELVNEEYNSILTSITEDAEKIFQCLPTLAEYEKRTKSCKSKTYWKEIILGGIVVAFALVFFEYIKDLISPPKK